GGQALLEPMVDERQLIGPLQAMADDAFTMAARPARLNPLLARLQTKLTSHLAHEEADALPLLGQIMSPAELGAIARALRGGGRAAHTIPWALAHATPPLPTPAPRHFPAPTPPAQRASRAPAPPPPPPAAVKNTKVRPPARCSAAGAGSSVASYPRQHCCGAGVRGLERHLLGAGDACRKHRFDSRLDLAGA